MAGKPGGKGGGARKIGRDKKKCERYKNFHTREKNKVKRVLRSNGMGEATAYAASHNLLGYLKTIPHKEKKQKRA